MGNSLASGVSGLRAHSNLLDVIGNNLANLNTIAYKSHHVYFSDLLYDTRRSASGGVASQRGGVNPVQVGSGVQIAQIGSNLSQGNLDSTGGQFDFGIEGDGYFVATNGTKTYYTRAGAFGLDASGVLVDPATGYQILRFGALGEPTGEQVTGPLSPDFQSPGDQRINVPIGAIVPGDSTDTVEISGVLTSDATGPLAQQLTSSTPYTTSGGSPATASTFLNSLDSNLANYTTGDVIQITGTDFDGSVINSSVNVDANTMLGDIITAIDAAYTGASASLDADGYLVLQANTTGNGVLNLVLSDATGNTGSDLAP